MRPGPACPCLAHAAVGAPHVELQASLLQSSKSSTVPLIDTLACLPILLIHWRACQPCPMQAVHHPRQLRRHRQHAHHRKGALAGCVAFHGMPGWREPMFSVLGSLPSYQAFLESALHGCCAGAGAAPGEGGAAGLQALCRRVHGQQGVPAGCWRHAVASSQLGWRAYAKKRAVLECF